ncbi:substrate-binding domain-containing protein [Paramagnetospirillum kuznetsovii]|nr:hypothetical protein [Paramagnetospirillum kuznetsovii]
MAALSGCLSNLPAPDSIQLAPVPGVALPFKARVMVFVGETDIARKLTIALTRYQSEETNIREGLALAKAAKLVLAKGFETVEVNDPSIRPQIVVKLTGSKASWSRLDGKMKTGCAVDAWTSDGIPLGNFVARYDADRTDYTSELEAAFAQCLKKPVEELLNSPALARLAGTGFRAPSVAAYDAWMRSLGPIPPFM